MRLTERDDSGYRNGVVLLNVSDQYANKLYYKLRDLEDIEDELGIDLVTLFKATKGIWIKRKDKIIHITDNVWINLSTRRLGCTCVGKYDGHWPRTGYDDLVNGLWAGDFKNYGKTWALTKNELEELE